jgi:hypothetical protein
MYDVDDLVITVDRPHMAGRILGKTSSSVTIDVIGRGTTTWSPQTIVRRYIPANRPAPAAETPEPSKPAETQGKPREQKPESPKLPGGKDVFGVKMGSMASLVNQFLLSKLDKITVEDVVANVAGSKPDNVRSHLRRMCKDGLLENAGTDKVLVVSVPSKFRSGSDARSNSGEVEKPVEPNSKKRSQRSGSGNRNEDGSKADGKTSDRSKRSDSNGKGRRDGGGGKSSSTRRKS